MLKFFATLALIAATLFPAPAAKADGCSADVFLRDWSDGFKTNIEAFDWCFTRVKWWKLDQSDGWKGRYCHLGQYQYNGYTYYSMLFFHKDKSYQNAQYTDSIFYAFTDDYVGRVGKGWPAQVEIHFSNNCSRY